MRIPKFTGMKSLRLFFLIQITIISAEEGKFLLGLTSLSSFPNGKDNRSYGGQVVLNFLALAAYRRLKSQTEANFLSLYTSKPDFIQLAKVLRTKINRFHRTINMASAFLVRQKTVLCMAFSIPVFQNSQLYKKCFYVLHSKSSWF